MDLPPTIIADVKAAPSVDDLILQCSSANYRKVAMVVGMVMSERRGLVDIDIAKRVKVLVASGKLEAQGDLDQMRYSEVRLPSH